MTDEALRAAILADPAAAAFAAVGADGDAAAAVAATLPPTTRPTYVTTRVLHAAFGPDAAEAVLGAIAAAAASNPVLARVLTWVDPNQGGIDVGNPITREQLDALAAAGVLAAGQVAAIKALAERPAAVSASDVTRVMQGYR